MDDLISRQAVLDLITEERCENGFIRDVLFDKVLISLMDKIRRMPSAVVRCKDCQHLGEYLTEEKTYPNWCMINQQFVIHPENWYCKGGEGEDDE